MKSLSTSLAVIIAVIIVGGSSVHGLYASNAGQDKHNKMLKQKASKAMRIFKRRTRGSSVKLQLRTRGGGSGPMQSTTVTCVSTDSAGKKKCMDAANTMQANGWGCSSVPGGTECTTN